MVNAMGKSKVCKASKSSFICAAVCSYSNVDCGCQRGASGNVNRVTDNAIMFQNRSSINNDIISQLCGYIDDRACHDRWAVTNHHRLGDNCLRVNSRYNLKPMPTCLLIELSPGVRIPNSAYSNESIVLILQLRQETVIP